MATNYSIIFELIYNLLDKWVYVLSHVWLSETPWTVAHQAPLSMGILQARKLEWVAMPSSRGSSQPRDQTQVTHNAGGFFTMWATQEAWRAAVHGAAKSQTQLSNWTELTRESLS